MVIKKVKYLPKEIDFITPFVTSANIYDKRKILLISVEDEKHNIGIGECAPLHEFGTETIDQAEKKINEVKSELINYSLAEFNKNNIQSVFDKLNNFPSLRFAFEQAILNLMSKSNPGFYNNLYETNINKSVIINAAIGLGESEIVIKTINDFVNSGFNTIKLKCGREKFDDDLKIIDDIKNIFGNKINLRIDINGKWKLEDAKIYLTELEEYNLEYIEQPVINNEVLAELSSHSNVNLAADESVKNIDDAIYLLNNGIKFIILKPSVIGGIFNSIEILKEAELHGAFAIISSSFESAVGKSALVYLAALTNHNYAHGLGINSLYKSDICKDPYPILNGTIHFDLSKYPPEYIF